MSFSGLHKILGFYKEDYLSDAIKNLRAQSAGIFKQAIRLFSGTTYLTDESISETSEALGNQVVVGVVKSK